MKKTFITGKYRSSLETKRCIQGVRVSLPVLTVQGRRPGKTAVIMAAQHGTELNGIAVIERVFSRLDPRQLKGRVVFLPVMNPIGVRAHIGSYPIGDGDNMNRVWWEALTAPSLVVSRSE